MNGRTITLERFIATLPDGWTYVPRVPPKVCPTCRHVEPQRDGSLTSPSGRRWPLVGNKSDALEREMVTAVIEAHT